MTDDQCWVLQTVGSNVHDLSFVIQKGIYKIKIGRGHDCDIIFNIQHISKHHCEIIIENNKVFIKDCGSRNGTYIEGSELLKEDIYPLELGNLISFGRPFFGGEILPDQLVFKLTASKLFTSKVSENIEEKLGSVSNGISSDLEISFRGFELNEVYQKEIESKLHRMKNSISLLKCKHKKLAIRPKCAGNYKKGS